MRKLINSFVDLHPKVSARKKNWAVYVKEAEQIKDILALMGASQQIFAFENVRMTKEIRNQANRINNCDHANIDKALKASEKHMAAINKIIETRGLEFLPPKLYDVAVLRMENPEASLQELADMCDPPMKKSGINNRFRKIEEIANKL